MDLSTGINSENFKTKEICLAPMLDVTTANFRRFVRLTSEHTILFTELIVANTVIHIDKEKLIERLGDIDERTVVQIGGSDVNEIVNAICVLKDVGCKHFNLNVGCPSTRVQKGCFGAVLMKNKELISEIINSVYKKCDIVLSLKIRTGVDNYDTYEFFRDFVHFLVKNTPVKKFYVHARKCWLLGLSPKQNRNIPPLNYSFVYKIKEEFPHVLFILNGGLKKIADFNKLFCNNNLTLDGIMIGREAIKNILVFRSFENYLHESSQDTIFSVVKKYLNKFELSKPITFRILNPLQNILHGQKGTKKWKIFLNESVHKKKLTVSDFIDEIESLRLLDI